MINGVYFGYGTILTDRNGSGEGLKGEGKKGEDAEKGPKYPGGTL